MKPAMIIEAKPVDHFVFGLTTAGKAHSMEPFDLHGTKQRFGHCVVPAIALAAHRASHAEGRKLLLEISAGVLAASVRMKDQAGCWPSAEPSHAQCVDDQSPCHALAHGKADDLTTEQIDDDGEIDPAFLGPEISDVACPDPVWRIDGKLAFEQVRRKRRLSPIPVELQEQLAILCDKALQAFDAKLCQRLVRRPDA